MAILFLQTLPALISVTIALFTFIFFYALSGVHFFKHVRYYDTYSTFENFGTLDHAMIALFRLITASGWSYLIPHFSDQGYTCDITECPEPPCECANTAIAAIWFWSFFLITHFMLVQVYTAVVIQKFSISDSSGKMVVTSEHIKLFNDAWMKLDPEYKLYLTSSRTLVALLRAIGPPLGEDLILSDTEMVAFIKKLDIKFKNGKIHYLDVIESCVKNALDLNMSTKIPPGLLPNSYKLVRARLDKRIAAEQNPPVLISVYKDWAASIIQNYVKSHYLPNKNSKNSKKMEAKSRQPPPPPSQDEKQQWKKAIPQDS